jgi:hypothetical protein
MLASRFIFLLAIKFTARGPSSYRRISGLPPGGLKAAIFVYNPYFNFATREFASSENPWELPFGAKDEDDGSFVSVPGILAV